MRRSAFAVSPRRPHALWVVWAPQAPRSQRLAAALGVEIYLVHFLAFQRPLVAPLKYIAQAWVTWRLLWRQRPRLVLVQNPPIFAVMLVALYAHLARGQFVIDAHTGALVGRKWQWSRPLHRWLSRRARATVVTNAALRDILLQGPLWRARQRRWLPFARRQKGVEDRPGMKGEVLVVEDPPAELNDTAPASVPQPGARQVVAIGSYGPDEPVAALLSAARQLPDVSFAITGDERRLPPKLRAACPPNVTLTGWLNDTEYGALLRRANVIVALTRRDHTLLCGAWEALYAGQPLVTSNWPVLQTALPQGTVFTGPDPDDIGAAVRLALAHEDHLRAAMQALAVQKRQAWETAFAELRRLVDDGSHGQQKSDAPGTTSADQRARTGGAVWVRARRS